MELPPIIELDDAEQISLSVLVEKITARREEIRILEERQARILAKIEKAQGFEAGTILTNYQFDGQSLFIPKG